MPKIPFLSIIIPAYNEEKRIGTTLFSVADYLRQKGYLGEILVVDDGSKDGTVKLVKEIQKQITQIKVIENKENHGKGYVVRQGMLKAQGKYLIFMDADNATRMEEFDKALPYLQEGIEVVIGSRHIKGSYIKIEQPYYRRLLGRAANLLIRLVLLPGIRDTQCGFKVFGKKAAREIFSRQTIMRWGFDMEILVIAKSLGYKIKEFPVNWYNALDSRVRPIKGAVSTLRELYRIKVNQIKGLYKQHEA